MKGITSNQIFNLGLCILRIYVYFIQMPSMPRFIGFLIIFLTLFEGIGDFTKKECIIDCIRYVLIPYMI